MKRALTVGVAAVAMASMLSLVVAGTFKRAPSTPASAAEELATLTLASSSSYLGVARIIHVPQRGEHASVDPNELEANNDYVEPVPPSPSRRHAVPLWPRQSEAPAPQTPTPGPRRTVLSAPPRAAEGPTPIRPTPRFTATDRSEQFSAPDNTAAIPPPARLPADTIDPATLPPSE